MNNNIIINCSEGINENDVCTMKNLRNLSLSYRNNYINNDNQRITGVAEGIALNDAVNVKQLNNINFNYRRQISDLLNYKSARLTFNRHGIAIIYKAPVNSLAVGCLMIFKNSEMFNNRL